MKPEPPQPVRERSAWWRLALAVGHSRASQWCAALAAVLLLIASLMPDVLSMPLALGCIVGLGAGLSMPYLAREAPSSKGGDERIESLLAQDISTSQQAFSVLQQQVAATIQTSEAAVFTVMERIDHIHRLSQAMSAQAPLTLQQDVQSMTEDILEILGQMQFQDINRQLLEQINRALGGLSDHFSQLYLLMDGKAPPPPQLLEELLQRWTAEYVMYEQWAAHSPAADAGRGTRADAGATGLQLASGPGPRIELF